MRMDLIVHHFHLFGLDWNALKDLSLYVSPTFLGENLEIGKVLEVGENLEVGDILEIGEN